MAFLGADRLADRARATAAFAGDEAEHQRPLFDEAFVDQHRAAKHVGGRDAVAARFAQQAAQGDAAHLDQGQAQFIQVAEVAVEGRRHHAGLAGDLAQAQGGVAAALSDQRQRGFDQALPGALLALEPGDRGLRFGRQGGGFAGGQGGLQGRKGGFPADRAAPGLGASIGGRSRNGRLEWKLHRVWVNICSPKTRTRHPLLASPNPAQRFARPAPVAAPAVGAAERRAGLEPAGPGAESGLVVH